MNSSRTIHEVCPTISVGALSANLLMVGDQIRRLEKAGVKLLHFDVMDGCFTPSMTVGAPLVKAVKGSLIKDVHLMIQNPCAQMEDFVKAGADMITVQLESCDDISPTLKKLKDARHINDPERPIVCGLSLLPTTPPEMAGPFLSQIDLLLLLNVDPTKKILEPVPFHYFQDRYSKMKRLAQQKGSNLLFCIDGGITKNNIARYAALSPDIIVSGSAVFEQGVIEENFKDMSKRMVDSQAPPSSTLSPN